MQRIVLCLVLLCAAANCACAETKPVNKPVIKSTTPAAQTDVATIDFSKYDALIVAITIFALACFVGYEIIGKVPTTLHTPLMSGSNAISGITVVGAIIVGSFGLSYFSAFLGFLGIVLAMINVVGGFLVTHRMLAMFKRK